MLINARLEGFEFSFNRGTPAERPFDQIQARADVFGARDCVAVTDRNRISRAFVGHFPQGEQFHLRQHGGPALHARSVCEQADRARDAQQSQAEESLPPFTGERERGDGNQRKQDGEYDEDDDMNGSSRAWETSFFTCLDIRLAQRYLPCSDRSLQQAGNALDSNRERFLEASRVHRF